VRGIAGEMATKGTECTIIGKREEMRVGSGHSGAREVSAAGSVDSCTYPYSYTYSYTPISREVARFVCTSKCTSKHFRINQHTQSAAVNVKREDVRREGKTRLRGAGDGGGSPGWEVAREEMEPAVPGGMEASRRREKPEIGHKRRWRRSRNSPPASGTSSGASIAGKRGLVFATAGTVRGAL
jgi:hypothetical protein